MGFDEKHDDFRNRLDKFYLMNIVPLIEEAIGNSLGISLEDNVVERVLETIRTLDDDLSYRLINKIASQLSDKHPHYPSFEDELAEMDMAMNLVGKINMSFASKSLTEVYRNIDYVDSTLDINKKVFVRYYLELTDPSYSYKVLAGLSPLCLFCFSKNNIENLLLFFTKKRFFSGLLNTVSFVAKGLELDVLKFYYQLPIDGNFFKTKIASFTKDQLFEMFYLSSEEKEELNSLLEVRNGLSLISHQMSKKDFERMPTDFDTFYQGLA